MKLGLKTPYVHLIYIRKMVYAYKLMLIVYKNSDLTTLGGEVFLGNF